MTYLSEITSKFDIIMQMFYYYLHISLQDPCWSNYY